MHSLDFCRSEILGVYFDYDLAGLGVNTLFVNA